ncbi:MAG: hypothetical protein F4Z74_05020 [Acidobacteria bacterium]|nr:hypothetical protein [Acidobacteriota bacterium]
MLAIVIVGSTINFLLFGSEVAGDGFSEVVAALTTLSGSVIGFYFGGRTAAPPPDNNQGGKSQDGGPSSQTPEEDTKGGV